MEGKEIRKWRPLPLQTVEFQKLVSQKLRIDSSEAMAIAEELCVRAHAWCSRHSGGWGGEGWGNGAGRGHAECCPPMHARCFCICDNARRACLTHSLTHSLIHFA